MKIHIPTYYSLLPVLLLLVVSCSEDRQASVRAEKALHEVASRYRSEKSILDSLLDVATSYYLPELAKGDTTLSVLSSSSEQAECMLYEGIRHHDRAQQQKPDMTAYASEIAQAYRFFLEVERNIELLPHAYLKAVVNDRLAIINVQNGNYPNAHSHFLKELQHTLPAGDSADIALSYMHLAYSFYTLEEGDSALYYSNQALSLTRHLDPRSMAALFANTAYYQSKFGLAKNRTDSLLSQIPFEACTKRDSCRIYIILADYYIGENRCTEADSLLRWTIANADSKPEILSMAYLRRSNMFEKIGLPDSALLMQKELLEQQRLANQSRLGEEVAEARGQYELLLAQHSYNVKVATIIIIALVAIIALLLLWLKRIRKSRELEHRIAILNEKMNLYSTEFLLQQQNLDQQKTLFEQQKQHFEGQQEQFNRQQQHFERQIAQIQERTENLTMLLAASDRNNKDLHSHIDNMLRHFFLLDSNAQWPPSIYEELINIYRESSADRRRLLEELDKLSFSPRQKVICMLIHENKHDSNQLWFISGSINKASFQSTKSQIKQKLIAAADSSSEIQKLLKYFPQEKGPLPRSKPQLKNNTKK